MSLPSNSRNPARRASDQSVASRLEKAVASFPADRPLPTTRQLGRKLGISNTTVYRMLQSMASGGALWQHPRNGRYYRPGARALFERPMPLACLIRRLELGSEQYREILEGISLGCGALHRTMLLWHDELLVNHPVAHESPVFATSDEQRAILGDFLDRHGASAGGFIMDHIWSDAALRAEGARLKPAVVLFRSCAVEGLGNIRADFRGGAMKALTYLLGRGFEQIVPVIPFAGDLAVAEFMAAFERAADETGCRGRLAPVAAASTDQERFSLIDRLQREGKRVALVCPEDNVTLFLAAAVRAAGIRCPDRIGLLSVMGTDFATAAGLSSLRYDFRRMGRLAVDTLAATGTVQQHLLEPVLFTGETT